MDYLGYLFRFCIYRRSKLKNLNSKSMVFAHLWGHFDWVACFDYFCPYARVKKLALMKLALNDLSTAFFAVLVQHFGNPSVRLQLDCEPFVTVAVFSDNAFESHIWK